MKKKRIIIVVVLIVLAVGGFFLYRNLTASRSVGLKTTNTSQNNKTAKVKVGNKKTLVLYFSQTGNTQKLANEIYDQVGGDIRRIERTTPYPSGQKLFDVTEKEANNNTKVKIKDLNINIDDYDTIFIGYPIWWYKMPMAMYTFFDQYDLSGKTIIPFNTHNGSGNGGTFDEIRKLEPKATVKEGLTIAGNDMDKDQSAAVKSWLNKVKS